MRALRVRSLLHGERETIAGTVYGTIVVLSLLTAGAAAYKHDLWRLVAITASSMVVLWAAHVYSHALGESVTSSRRLSAAELAAIARREASIVLAAVLPLAAVGLGAAGVVGDAAALWIAFGLGVAALAVQAVRYAHLERLSGAGTVLAVALNLGFGLVFVALKTLLTH
jgi:heme/copper-type cytochrome/quinol oxidase subunit 4